MKILPALIISLFLAASAAAENYVVGVNGMTCAACAKAISREVSSVEGVERVEVNIDAKQVNVVTKGNTVAPEAIRAAITTAGYEPMTVEKEETKTQ